MLQKCYGDDTLSKTQVYQWYERFKSGREAVEDDARPGRPSTSKTDENVDEIRQLLIENRKLTIREIRYILDTRYPDKWMGRGGSIIWLARSPDLNVLDYFIWGHIKDLVEHFRNGTEAEARETILAAFKTITIRNGASRDTQYYSKSRNLLTRARKALGTILALKCNSGLDLLGIPLKKNAPCYLPPGDVEMIVHQFFTRKMTKIVIIS
ncbi:GVQW3 protein, partial [Acromyrmex heyeri]